MKLLPVQREILDRMKDMKPGDKYIYPKFRRHGWNTIMEHFKPWFLQQEDR